MLCGVWSKYPPESIGSGLPPGSGFCLIRLGDHVRLVDAGEPLHRRPVEADPLRERALQLGRGDRDRLEETEHIGEPQPDETDVPLLQGPEHELFLPVHD